VVSFCSAKGRQVEGQVSRGAQSIGVVLTQDSALAVQGVLGQVPGSFQLI